MTETAKWNGNDNKVTQYHVTICHRRTEHHVTTIKNNIYAKEEMHLFIRRIFQSARVIFRSLSRFFSYSRSRPQRRFFPNGKRQAYAIDD